jgi:hypothetical protein
MMANDGEEWASNVKEAKLLKESQSQLHHHVR